MVEAYPPRVTAKQESHLYPRSEGVEHKPARLQRAGFSA
jgi:hypothetical protein